MTIILLLNKHISLKQWGINKCKNSRRQKFGETSYGIVKGSEVYFKKFTIVPLRLIFRFMAEQKCVPQDDVFRFASNFFEYFELTDEKQSWNPIDTHLSERDYLEY